MELGTPPKYGTEANALTAHHAAVDVHVFGNRNGFAYLLFSASSVGVAMAQLLQTGTVSILSSCDRSDVKAFCSQAKLAISLGFGAFFVLALSSCITGLRVARWWLS
ncbi:unnamed protein product [Sphagnum compactum]